MADSMSYKLDLSELDRDGDVSITQQLVDRFSAAIEAGELEPGDKLPPTRELATRGGRQPPDRRARVPPARRARLRDRPVGRGTFVRTLAPAPPAPPHGDDWQVYALPPAASRTPSRSSHDAFSLRERERPHLARRPAGPPRQLPDPASSPRSPPTCFEEGAARRSPTCPPRGCSSCASSSPRVGGAYGWAEDADEIMITSGAQQAIALVRARDARAGRRGRRRVAHVHRHDDRSLRGDRRARDRRARGRARPRRGRARAPARPPRGEARRRCRARARTRPGAASPTSAARAWPSWRVERNFFVARGPRVRRHALRRRARPPAARAGAGARDLRELALEGRSAAACGIGWVAARGPVRERIAMLKMESDFHSPTLIQHMAARWLATEAYERHVAATIPFYRERRDALMAALERHLPGRVPGRPAARAATTCG